VIRVTRLAIVAALGASLGGCIAAVIPVAASSAMVKKRMETREQAQAGQQAPRQPTRPGQAEVPAPPGLSGTWKRVDGMTAMPPPSGTAPAPATTQPRGAVPAGMQYLYGSGEAAALSVQAYGALTRYLRAQLVAAKHGEVRQVVLADGASLNAPRFEPCGKKPLAAVFDIDETAILNLGYEADEARRRQL
jgi:hypothetical protein